MCDVIRRQSVNRCSSRSAAWGISRHWVTIWISMAWKTWKAANHTSSASWSAQGWFSIWPRHCLRWSSRHYRSRAAVATWSNPRVELHLQPQAHYRCPCSRYWQQLQPLSATCGCPLPVRHSYACWFFHVCRIRLTSPWAHLLRF